MVATAYPYQYVVYLGQIGEGRVLSQISGVTHVNIQIHLEIAVLRDAAAGGWWEVV